MGRLEYGGKGLDLLLAAWAQVHRMVEADLVIAGGGPDEDRVRREVDRLGLAERVRFAGWVTGEAKWRLLAGARLAVVSSRHETFGMVALEAMATATPVVAFDIPGLHELVPDGCGWRVPPSTCRGWPTGSGRPASTPRSRRPPGGPGAGSRPVSTGTC